MEADRDGPELAARIEAMLGQAQEAYPAIRVDSERFAAHVRAHAEAEDDAVRALERMHARGGCEVAPPR